MFLYNATARLFDTSDNPFLPFTVVSVPHSVRLAETTIRSAESGREKVDFAATNNPQHQ